MANAGNQMRLPPIRLTDTTMPSSRHAIPAGTRCQWNGISDRSRALAAPGENGHPQRIHISAEKAGFPNHIPKNFNGSSPQRHGGRREPLGKARDERPGAQSGKRREYVQPGPCPKSL